MQLRQGKELRRQGRRHAQEEKGYVCKSKPETNSLPIQGPLPTQTLRHTHRGLGAWPA